MMTEDKLYYNISKLLQTLTYSNTRCSVLAAANPVYGRYDQYKTPMENIGLQDSLLSRFDCLFIMLDVADPDSDRRIADHVVRMHRYR